MKKRIVVIAFREPGNYLESNIAYFSIPSGGCTDEEQKQFVHELIVHKGYAKVVVAIDPTEFGRGVVAE